MSSIALTDPLKAEYQRLFDNCNLRPESAAEIEAILARIRNGQPRYRAVAADTDVPWHVIAVLHQMECSGSFDKHLHNGDPLSARTVRVPANRPPQGTPPFAWEDSAVDALRFQRFDRWKDWSLSGTLYRIESYNGWGYRLYHPETLSPYLWGGSNNYAGGKYVQDGRWSASAVSRQIGAAVLLRRMAESGLLLPAAELPHTPGAPAEKLPLLRYSPNTELPYARELQAFLNTLPDIYLKVDGKPGERTSDAFRKATGNYLAGDPRAS
jgi:lysozyme family protein